MATVNPSLNIKLSGKNTVTEFDKLYYIDVDTKIEQVYSLNTLSGEQAIDLSDITGLSYLFFMSDSNFNLRITTATDELTMTTKLFILQGASSFIEDITGIFITATSTDAKQKIEVKLYGEG